MSTKNLGLVFIEVGNDPIQPSRPFTDKNTGMLKTIPAKQTAYMWGRSLYPAKFEIPVDEQDGPLLPGRYFLGGDVFASGEYSRLKFNDRNVQLIPEADVFALLNGGEVVELPASRKAG